MNTLQVGRQGLALTITTDEGYERIDNTVCDWIRMDVWCLTTINQRNGYNNRNNVKKKTSNYF